MKHLLLTLLLVSLTSATALADSPEAILKDYRKQAAQAVERLNQSLEKAATPIITKLVSSGDTAGAELLTSQMKAKIAGEPVAAPQASAVQLFALYDDARAKALAPVQKSSIARIESLLKTAGGAKLDMVAELGKVREKIEDPGMSLAEPFSKSDYRSHLRKNKIPQKWGYFLSDQYNKRYGTLTLNEDGTMSIEAASPATGTWEPTSNPMVLLIDLQKGEKTPEKTELIINGNQATMKRVVGMRYLKAD